MVKRMKRQKTTENYLKAIYLLSKVGQVRGTDIAAYLSVSRPTVSVSLRSLEQEGYLYLDALHEVHLTDKGKRLAKSIYEKNQIFKDLLIRLGVDEATAEKDACEMEHAVSAESFSALKRMIHEANTEDV